MRRLYCALIGPLVALVVIARCVGQSGEAQDPPKDEAQCSPQEVADRFLEVRARLDKPGERPEYRLGEPVVVHLDIRNTSEAHLFKLIGWHDPVPPCAVEATSHGKPVPNTTRGQFAVERCKKGRGPFEPDGSDQFVSQFAEVSKPTEGTIMASLLCDMTMVDEYELKVRCRVRVLPHDAEAPGGLGAGKTVVKEVRLAKPLRLRVVHRLYRLEAQAGHPAPRRRGPRDRGRSGLLIIPRRERGPC